MEEPLRENKERDLIEKIRWTDREGCKEIFNHMQKMSKIEFDKFRCKKCCNYVCQMIVFLIGFWYLLLPSYASPVSSFDFSHVRSTSFPISYTTP